MSNKGSVTLSGIVVTVLFGGTLGVLVTVASFGLLRIGQSALEALGHLPLRWGENNLDTLLELSLAVSLPLVIWFVVWFYKRALKAEQDLVGYKYTPPAK